MPLGMKRQAHLVDLPSHLLHIRLPVDRSEDRSGREGYDFGETFRRDFRLNVPGIGAERSNPLVDLLVSPGNLGRVAYLADPSPRRLGYSHSWRLSTTTRPVVLLLEPRIATESSLF